MPSLSFRSNEESIVEILHYVQNDKKNTLRMTKKPNAPLEGGFSLPFGDNVTKFRI